MIWLFWIRHQGLFLYTAPLSLSLLYVFIYRFPFFIYKWKSEWRNPPEQLVRLARPRLLFFLILGGGGGRQHVGVALLRNATLRSVMLGKCLFSRFCAEGLPDRCSSLLLCIYTEHGRELSVHSGRRAVASSEAEWRAKLIASCLSRPFFLLLPRWWWRSPTKENKTEGNFLDLTDDVMSRGNSQTSPIPNPCPHKGKLINSAPHQPYITLKGIAMRTRPLDITWLYHHHIRELMAVYSVKSPGRMVSMKDLKLIITSLCETYKGILVSFVLINMSSCNTVTHVEGSPTYGTVKSEAADVLSLANSIVSPSRRPHFGWEMLQGKQSDLLSLVNLLERQDFRASPRTAPTFWSISSQGEGKHQGWPLRIASARFGHRKGSRVFTHKYPQHPVCFPLETPTLPCRPCS